MFIKIFAIAFPVMLAIDMVWLMLIAKDFYRAQIGFLMREQVTLVPAVILYILLAGALVIFIIEPALTKGSWVHALMYGAMFGFVAYAAYDLTNLATLKDWPLTVSVVDMLWGATLAASVSTATYFVVTKIGL